MELNFYFDFDEGTPKAASLAHVIATRIFTAARRVIDLLPGGEIIVSTTVSNEKLYNWLKRTGFSILNRFFTKGRMNRIIKKAFLKNGILNFGWRIVKAGKGKYQSLETGKYSGDNCYQIVMHNTPMSVIEEIATAFCREFRQETVLTHDLGKTPTTTGLRTVTRFECISWISGKFGIFGRRFIYLCKREKVLPRKAKGR